jgi:hypothetical protein
MQYLQRKVICIFCLGLAIFGYIAFPLSGDECILLPSEKKHVYGDTSIIMRVNPSETDFEISISIFYKEKFKAKFEGVSFERIYPSPKNDYFLGLSNSGIPGTAFVLFNKYGELLREVKHDFLDFIPYCHESIVCDRTWYNDMEPDVEYVFENERLKKVLITGCDGKRYNLYDQIIMHKSADGKIQQITLDESERK